MNGSYSIPRKEDRECRTQAEVRARGSRAQGGVREVGVRVRARQAGVRARGQ